MCLCHTGPLAISSSSNHIVFDFSLYCLLALVAKYGDKMYAIVAIICSFYDIGLR